MISIAENYLGTTALAAWEDWKKYFPEPLAQLVSQGNNIRNFTSTILRIINGGDTLSGLTIKQNEALRDLEQLQLHDWKKVVFFLNDFVHLAAISGIIMIQMFVT